MPLETATYISDLVTTNPASGDPTGQGDDHLRMIKNVLKLTLPTLNGALTTSLGTLNALDATVSSLQSQIASVSTNVGTETTARIAAINSEATARANAVASEASTRASQDATLNTFISNEASLRAAGDTNLQNQLANFVPWTAIRAFGAGNGVVIQLPGGSSTASPILLQIGSQNLATGNGDFVPYPVPFNQGVWGVLAVSSASNIPGSACVTNGVNNNAFKAWLNGPGGPGVSGFITFLALGV